MDQSQQPHRSYLFTVRLWEEHLGDGQAEWRGRVSHVVSGETHYFRDWPVFVALLQFMAAAARPTQSN